MADFTYISDSLDEDNTFSADVIKFGDGYSQRIPSGINNCLRKWNVSFTDRSKVDVDAMSAFWRARLGTVSFTWQPQGFSSEVKVVCTHFSKPIQNRWKDGDFAYTITASFEEVPL